MCSNSKLTYLTYRHRYDNRSCWLFKTPPSKKSQCQPFASLQRKREVQGRAFTIALHLYTSDIEIKVNCPNQNRNN